MFNFELIDPEEMIDSDDFAFIESFLKCSGQTQIGWHYIIDMVWLYSKVKKWPRTLKVLDAGGGRGPCQFLLAELGFEISNIDLFHIPPSRALTDRYGINLRKLNSYKPTNYKDYIENANFENGGLKSSLKKWILTVWPNALDRWRSWKSKEYNNKLDKWRSRWQLDKNPVGEIEWVTGNLCQLPEISTGYFDAVISLSSLEHIPLEMLDQGLEEIRRVLKEDAHWAVTTSGTEKFETWFHEPSKGLCFSIADIKKYFKAIDERAVKPEIIIEKYRRNKYLKDNIAEFYKKSGDNGMPWGKWEPKYFPVGIFEISN